MNPKPCPECKSENTKQLDKAIYGDQAYCLSCYNKFKSFYKDPEKKIDRFMKNKKLSRAK